MTTTPNTTKRLGKNQQKLLLLLMGGVAIGLSQSPRQQYRVLREMAIEWRKLDQAHLRRIVDPLYKSKLVSKKVHKDGSISMILTERGKRHALQFHLDTLTIPVPKKWNGKWHVVMYDVPEEKRWLRIKLYTSLRMLGFVELQHSVFVHPYECTDQIEFLIEAHDAREYVRRLIADEIDITDPVKHAFAQEAKRSLTQRKQRHAMR